MTYTPGPWKFRIYATDDDPAELEKHGIRPVKMLSNDGQATVMGDINSEENHRPVARVECHTKFKRGQGHAADCAERDANARLIAAAPDLLETLKKIVAISDRKHDAWDAAHAAIAKAEGRQLAK